jgi:hypothetical protein
LLKNLAGDKKSLSKKSLVPSFSNLTLKSREARGIPKNQWFSLANAKENLNNSDLSTLLVGLYANLLTYFTKNY